jgi:signal transduction histidine kinase/ligand-binding sensor domain-containing protein
MRRRREVEAGLRRVVSGVLLLLISVAPSIARDQFADLAVRRYSVDEGLSQNTVNALLQDRLGFLWLGTEDGLSRFDGYSFTTFPRAPGRPGAPRRPVISALHEDASGQIWVGSADGELDRYDPERGAFVPFPTEGTASGRATIRAIVEDERRVLWIATQGAGLLRIDPARQSISRVGLGGGAQGDLGNWVLSLHEDRGGAIWAGTDRGLFRIDPATDAVAPVLPELPPNEGPRGVFSIQEDAEGALWAGAGGGWLISVDRDRGAATASVLCAPPQPERAKDHRVIATFDDPARGLWAVTTRGGLYQVDRAGGLCQAAASGQQGAARELVEDFLTAAIRDRAGRLWLGTLTSGVKHVFSRKAFGRLAPKAGQGGVDVYVWAVVEDRTGAVWVGTEGQGLFRGDRDGNRFERQLEPGGGGRGYGTVWSLLEDRRGELWVGLRGGGLHRFDRTRTRVTRYSPDPERPGALRSDRVRVLYEDGTGTLWLGTGNGLHRHDPRTDRFERWLPDEVDEPAKAPRNNVNALATGADGRIWVGTRGGMLLFDPRAGRFSEMPEQAPAALRRAAIRAVLARSDGSVWIGTHGEGLFRADSAASGFLHWGEAEGLANDVVYGIAEDRDGRLWVSTNRGLSRLDPGSGVIRNYDAADGLQSNEFNAGAVFRAASGRLYFGGVSGVTAFHPDEIADDSAVPPVRITGLRLFNEPVPLGRLSDGRTILERSLLATSALRLSHRDRMIGFEFVALAYVRPEKVAYAYRLEGFDEGWVKAGGSRVATYTNLRPGHYVFNVRAANADGIWNEEGASLTLDIPTPIWQATWFRSGVVLALGLAFVGLVRLRVRRAHRRADELELANQRLSHSLARWRSLVENAPAAVLSVDRNLCVEFVNVGPAEAAAFVGRPVLDALGDASASSPARAALLGTLQDGEPSAFLVEAPTIGGSGRSWYRVRAGAVREESRITGLTLICLDVTEALRAEREREQLIETLEGRNAELERFTYTVSHDLRSPLVTVRGFVGYLEKDLAQGRIERASSDLARIRAATATMDRLLRELLDLSRIGRMTNPAEAVPLGQLAQEAAHLLDGRLRERHVQLEIQPDLPVLFGDRVRLLELLQNLIENAAKFMGTQAEPRIAIGVRPGPEGPVCFVQDNGIGIEPRFREKVFGLFERLDPTVDGTGIGLAIAKRIVEVHRGRIWVESEGTGRGSTFCFTLPAAPRAEPALS